VRTSEISVINGTCHVLDHSSASETGAETCSFSERDVSVDVAVTFEERVMEEVVKGTVRLCWHCGDDRSRWGASRHQSIHEPNCLSWSAEMNQRDGSEAMLVVNMVSLPHWCPTTCLQNLLVLSDVSTVQNPSSHWLLKSVVEQASCRAGRR